ncbi:MULTISPECIES: amino acid ABC transporter permease [Oscillospiraceae]|uniref:Amino acid ABC transporter permease n=1 Tax=Bittarella massiliensis (ex Durand et al. 2017) TaxID=1720313 RepID=A0AAW5KAJ9_9FIRM|nr:amino acid ABC transporter permease [Bittarella massiliensis (ex Durand et al. 2017)]
MNFSFWSGYKASYFSSLWMTLKLSLVSILFATLLGVLLYFLKTSRLGYKKLRPLSLLASAFIEVMRCVPMLLLMIIVYSGSKIALGFNFTSFQAAVIAIVMNASVYICEVVRAGIEAVDRGQMEAARSLGMSRRKAMWLVVMPQAVKNILPAIGNEFVGVIKNSSMASVIGVAELLFTSKNISGATFLPLEPLLVAAAFYFVLTFTLGRLMLWVERRYKVSDNR